MGLFGSKKGNAGHLSSFSYSPGYCDMTGESHICELKRTTRVSGYSSAEIVMCIQIRLLS